MDQETLQSVLSKHNLSDVDRLTPHAIRLIHKFYRQQDESYLFPVNGRFNVTDRAIRNLSELRNGYADCIYSYYAALDQEISRIVNAAI